MSKINKKMSIRSH